MTFTLPRRAVPIAMAAGMLALPGAATAAVTASADDSTILVVGTAGDDSTTFTDEGTNLRITNATAGSGCAQSGADALCSRGHRALAVGLQGGNDTLINASTPPARVSGGAGNDVVEGGPNADTLAGDDGNDRIVPDRGGDTMSGGNGIDTLDYSASPVPIHAKLQTIGGLRVTEFATTPSTDQMTDEFENVLGSAFADVLRGGPKANELVARGGSDVIDGGDGDDVLNGESGADRFGRVASTVSVTASAASVGVGNADTDGKDTVLGGSGNDDVNVRDVELDATVDCGTGIDVARQDLVDDDFDLDVDNCETLETLAVDQRAMTRVVKLQESGGSLALTLACPKRSRVACNGRAAMAKSQGGKPGRPTRYRIGRGKRARIVVSGASRKTRYLVLTEKDQERRVRRLVRRVR